MAINIEKEFKKVETQHPWVVVEHQLTPLRFLDPRLLPLAKEIHQSSNETIRQIIRKNKIKETSNK